MDDYEDFAYNDGTWIIATFAIPDGIAPAPGEVLRAFPDPFYDIHPGESITVVPNIEANDEVSISRVEGGEIVIAGVDTFPGWDEATKAAIRGTLRQLWNVNVAGQALIAAAEDVVKQAILRRELTVSVPFEDAVDEMTVPLKLMTENEQTKLVEVAESDLELVAALTAYDVAKELIPALAGLRIQHYDLENTLDPS